jgi:hypothetical protein
VFLIINSFSAFAQSSDPTKPLGFVANSTASKVKHNELTLQTIVESGEAKRVVINGQLLKVGDKIRQYQLSEITSSYALLSSPEKDLKLLMFSTVVAKSK